MANVPVSWTMSEADRAALVSAYCAEDGFTGTNAEMLAHFKQKQANEWRERTRDQQRREVTVTPIGEIT